MRVYAIPPEDATNRLSFAYAMKQGYREVKPNWHSQMEKRL